MYFCISIFTVLWYSDKLIPRGSAPWTPALPGAAAAGVREFTKPSHSLIHQLTQPWYIDKSCVDLSQSLDFLNQGIYKGGRSHDLSFYG